MKTKAFLKKNIKEMSGSILLIGEIEPDIDNIIATNSSIVETYFVNSNDKEVDDDTADESLADDISLNKLHKYLKQGVDNVICDYDEIKNHIPSFILETTIVTKKNLYLFCSKKSECNFMLKKYKRYKLNCQIEELDDHNVLIVEINDIIVHPIKEKYYYIIDNIEKVYLKIVDSI